MDASEAARRLSARRQISEHRCLWCGEAFQARSAARYCSQRCRSAAWKQRQRLTEAERTVGEIRAMLRQLPEAERESALRAIGQEGFLDMAESLLWVD